MHKHPRDDRGHRHGGHVGELTEADGPATFACFYVYGTVSAEPSVNAGLQRGKAEITSAEVQATPFSPGCQVYAPIYRQVTVADLQTHPDLNFGPAETVTAYDSIKAGFEAFLTHELDGRPFVVIGDSQGAAMLNMLLARLVDNVPALRSRLVTAIILVLAVLGVMYVGIAGWPLLVLAIVGVVGDDGVGPSIFQEIYEAAGALP